MHFYILQVTWLLLMLIMAKVTPNFVSCLACEFRCPMFQTYDVLMLGKLSVVKVEAENRQAVHNL